MRRSPALAALAAGSLLFFGASVEAQDTCDLLSSRSSTVQLTDQAIFSYISEPVFGCDGGVIIRADSATLNDATGYTRFIGNFEYRDSTAFMTADMADHFASEGRLIGVGNVHIVDDATGAVFEGDSTVLVGTSSQRATGQLTIVGKGRRAHALILIAPQMMAVDSTDAPVDSAGVAAAPVPATDPAGMPSDSAMVGADPESVTDSSGAPVDSGSAAADPVPAADPAGMPTDSTTAATESVPGANPAEAPTDSAAVAADPVPNPPEALADSAAVTTDSAAAPTDSAGASPLPDTTRVPYDIDAEQIYVRGTGHLLATGNAEVYNEEFRALADSIEYREEAGKLFLRGTAPRVYGYGAEYVLSGNEVDLDMSGNQVAARGEAALTGEELDLTAPEIRVLMEDGVLNRIVAMHERPSEPEPAVTDDAAADSTGDSAATADAGEAEEAVDNAGTLGRGESDQLALAEAVPGGEPSGGEPGEQAAAPGEESDSTALQQPARPRAVAESFELEGDSINVDAPDEVLERVVAVGNARGESLARDSLNTELTPEIARSDWVSGDTIIAVFEAAATGDTVPDAAVEPAADSAQGGYQLDRLIARGDAASLYRMRPPEDANGGEEDEPGETDQAPATGAPEEAAQEDPPDGAEVDPTDEASQDAGQPEPEEEAGVAGEEEEEAVEAIEAPRNCLALHYVRGDLITILMGGGEVTSVIVEGNARGVQLEPVGPSPPDCRSAPPQSATEMR